MYILDKNIEKLKKMYQGITILTEEALIDSLIYLGKNKADVISMDYDALVYEYLSYQFDEIDDILYRVFVMDKPSEADKLAYLSLSNNVIAGLYKERKETEFTLSTYKNYLEQIKRKLNSFPLIKCNTEFSKVQHAYNSHITTDTKCGMHIYELQETDKKYKKKNALYRTLNKGKINRNSKNLSEFRKYAQITLECSKKMYSKAYSKYLLFIKEEILNLLKDSELMSLALLSINSKLDNKLELKKNYKGVKTVSGECAREFDKETLYHIFAETSNFKEEGFITPKVFKEKFSHLITHGLEVEISKLNSRINKINRAIEQEFNNQYSVLNKEPEKKKIMN